MEVQSQQGSLKCVLLTVIHPETLQIRGYYHPYRPPIPVPACVARPPEDIEEEMRFVEKNLEKLISVSIQYVY